MSKPNILLLCIDTLRADEVGCINAKSNLTPNMDNLAKEGRVFTNCFSQGPNTPTSFPSFMSSTYPLMFGDYRKKGIVGRMSFVEILKDKGYFTVAYTTNANHHESFGYSKDFDIFFTGHNKSLFRNSFRSIKRHFASSTTIHTLYTVFFKPLQKQCNHFKKTSNIKFLTWHPRTDAEKLIPFAKTHLRSGRPPFFLWFHFMDVHLPYPDFDDASCITLMFNKDEGAKIPKEEIKRLKDSRHKRIRHVDEKIGELITYLKDEGLYDKTKIFICSDHGEELMEHGSLFHYPKLYDELIHVPLILNFGSGIYDGLCENIDIPVSILKEIGAIPPSIFMGEALGTKKKIIFSETIDVGKDERKICARTKKWKLIYSIAGGKIKMELYDLVSDPKENHDMSNSKPQIVSLLMEEINAHNKTKKLIERKSLIYKVKKKMKGNYGQHTPS